MTDDFHQNSEQNQSDSNQKTTKNSSKLPSFDEVSSMAGKLFRDIKKSVTEIYTDYKDKRRDANVVNPASTAQSSSVHEYDVDNTVSPSHSTDKSTSSEEDEHSK